MGYPTMCHRKAIDELGITTHHRKSFSPVTEKLNPTLWAYLIMRIRDKQQGIKILY